MPEVAWVVGIVVMLGAAGLVQTVPWPELLQTGYELMLDSAGYGIPLELLYFASLALALKQSGKLMAGWYWKPFLHHNLLSREQKVLVLPWFFGGAIAFVGIVLGIVITVLGMIAAVVQLK